MFKYMIVASICISFLSYTKPATPLTSPAPENSTHNKVNPNASRGNGEKTASITKIKPRKNPPSTTEQSCLQTAPIGTMVGLLTIALLVGTCMEKNEQKENSSYLMRHGSK